MLDDLRTHDPEPTRDESEWMGLDPLGAAAHALVMVGVSLMIGVTVSYIVSPENPGVAVASSARAAPH